MPFAGSRLVAAQLHDFAEVSRPVYLAERRDSTMRTFADEQR
jgi:hypothetical protein